MDGRRSERPNTVASYAVAHVGGQGKVKVEVAGVGMYKDIEQEQEADCLNKNTIAISNNIEQRPRSRGEKKGTSGRTGRPDGESGARH